MASVLIHCKAIDLRCRNPENVWEGVENQKNIFNFNRKTLFMNEQYLHLLWRTKRLPMHLLKTIDDKDLRILHIGVYNTASGPDFFNGRIELDGLQHSGNIELH